MPKPSHNPISDLLDSGSHPQAPDQPTGGRRPAPRRAQRAPRERRPRQPLGWDSRALLGAIVSAVGITALVWGGLPTLGVEFNWMWLGVGAVVAAAGIVAFVDARRGRETLMRRSHKISMGLVAAVTVFALVGAFVTPVRDGIPLPITSTDAAIIAYAEKVDERIGRLSEIDALFELNQTDARLAIAQLESAYTEVAGWVIGDDDDVPTPELAAVDLLIDQATGAAAEAIRARIEWVKSNDPVAEVRSNQFRASYVAAILEAGATLADIAADYGVVVGGAKGPVE